jgi:hemerythrin-like domain-containing protein
LGASKTATTGDTLRDAMFKRDFETLAATRRWDIYGPVHKGLRHAHSQLITRLGQADYAGDVRQLTADLRAHLAIAAKHLGHEETFIHAALEAAAPGSISALNQEHQQHRVRLAELGVMIEALESAAAGREAHGRMLYLAFAAFVAEDLEHMRHEETETWPLLCALFTDEQLADIEMRIIATLTPEDNIAMMRMMLPAMSPTERIGLLSGMKAGAPPEAYAAVIEGAARPSLPDHDFAELQRLDLAA